MEAGALSLRLRSTAACFGTWIANLGLGLVNKSDFVKDQLKTLNPLDASSTNEPHCLETSASAT